MLKKLVRKIRAANICGSLQPEDRELIKKMGLAMKRITARMKKDLTNISDNVK